MNYDLPRYLWEDVEPSHEMAARMEQAASNPELGEELQKLLRDGAIRLQDQQNQLGALIVHLIGTTPPEQVITLLLESGFTRHELASCWGIPKSKLILMDMAMKNK